MRAINHKLALLLPMRFNKFLLAQRFSGLLQKVISIDFEGEVMAKIFFCNCQINTAVTGLQPTGGCGKTSGLNVPKKARLKDQPETLTPLLHWHPRQQPDHPFHPHSQISSCVTQGPSTSFLCVAPRCRKLAPCLTLLPWLSCQLRHTLTSELMLQSQHGCPRSVASLTFKILLSVQMAAHALGVCVGSFQPAPWQQLQHCKLLKESFH